jgi:hypothetical protein
MDFPQGGLDGEFPDSLASCGALCAIYKNS